MCRRVMFVFVTLSAIFGSTQSEIANKPSSADDGKSSLVFVFDTTGSMYDDLRQLRESAEMILATALQESNIIADFVFVPFNDPRVGPETVTRDKEVFKSVLNMVRVAGGGDCPEMSLGGIYLALNVSRPRSFIYVFTDATAADYWLKEKVLDMVQRKQSQVVFVLTGDCRDLHKPSYKVYEQVAAASSGQIFNLTKTNVHKVLEMVRTSIRGRNVNLGAVVLPAGVSHSQEIPVDNTVAEVTVSLSGPKPHITVVNPQGELVTGPPQLVTMLDLSKIMVVKVLDPEPGKWNITVGSAGDYSVRVAGLSNVTFDYGFSVSSPKSMLETSHRPLKGTYNHMLLSVTPTDVPITIDYSEIVDLSGKTLFELPVKKTDAENVYLTSAFIPPSDFFYVAINGHDNDGQELRRIGQTAVQAKTPDVPYLTVPAQVEARSYERVTLKCGVESLVPVYAKWIKENMDVQPLTSSLQSTSIEYVIEAMTEEHAGTYWCNAYNDAGYATAKTVLDMKVDPPQVLIQSSGSSVPYGEKLNLTCEVFSEAPLLKMQLVFKSDGQLNDDVINVKTTPREDGVYIYNNIISPVDETHSGLYTCIAVNRAGLSKNSLKVTVEAVPIVHILGPHSIKKLIHSDVQLPCHVENAERVQWIGPDGVKVMDVPVNSTYDGMFDVRNVTNSGRWTCLGRRGPNKASDYIDVDILIKPTVRIEGDKNVTITNGTSIAVTCLVVAKPAPRIIWHRETESFLNHTVTVLENNVYKSLLTLNSSLENVAATYFCIGENSQGIGEDSIVVNMDRNISLLEGFGDKSIEIYNQLDLKCRVDSYSPTHITWYHNETKIWPEKNVLMSEDNSTMSITAVDVGNAGLYACVADNGYNKLQVNGTVTITGLVSPLLAKQPSKVIARKDQSTNLTCRILQGKPAPSLSWQYRSESSGEFSILPSDALLSNNDSELTIPVVRLTHAGVYRCVATNYKDKDLYDVQVIVQYAPQLTGSKDNSFKNGTLEVKEGEMVELSCEAVGHPPPMVVWTKDGRLLSFTSNVYLNDKNNLVIEKATEYDSGVFTCNAINTLGTSQKNFTIHVYVPPTISTAPLGPDVEALEGELVELPCATSAVPTPDVLWTHNGEGVNDQRKLIDEFGMRFIANLTDFGNYTCLAKNRYGNASISYFLYVWVAPSIRPLDNKKTVMVGENVTLQCDAVGFPLPSITWEFNQDAIAANTSDISFNEYGNLYITNASTKHEGNYACVAASIAGIDKRNVRLIVNELPKIINNFLGPYIATNIDNELVLPCNATGRPKPFTAWMKDGLYIGNDDPYYIDYDGSLIIKKPQEEMSGLYSCVAVSITGEANITIPVEIYSVPPQSENSQTVSLVEGTNASIVCPVKASRKDQVKWYKDARLISEGVLHISNITRHNYSEYACVVTNVAGSAYAKVTLEVEWPPTLDSGDHVEVIRGSDWYFECAADAKPAAKTQWLFNSKPMILDATARLKLLNVDARHNGTYECEVSNKHGRATKQYTLDVLDPPFISEFDFLEVQLREGSDAALECNARGHPTPDIKWTFNNTNWHLENSTLISRNISVNSEGVFRCDATNKAGKSYIQYRVMVVYAARIQDIVLYNSGEGTSVLDRIELEQGSRARISCQSSGQPIPKVQWIKNGNSLSENSDNVNYADLIMNDVHPVNAGVYSCVVSNIGGMDEKKIRLDVLEPPKILQNLFQNKPTGNTIHLEVLAGQTFSLHCHHYGTPTPEVYWFKDDLPLRFFDDKMVSTDFGEVIESSKALYDQSGNYTCVARNKIGNTSLVYLVDVLVPPPTFKDSLKISISRPGKLLNLTCPVEGSPVPQVSWLRQPYTEITQHTPRVTLMNDNFTLLINRTEVSDTGKYSCVMTNKVGTTEVVFEVNIEMPPSIAGNVGPDIVEDHVVPLMRSIVLVCEVKSHPSPIITWLKDTQELRDAPNVQRVLDSSLLGLWHVTSRDAGQYICLAENKAGAAHRRYNVIVTVPGKWTTWSTWGFCNVTCGMGYQQRTRSCLYVDDDNNTYDNSTNSERVVLDETECKGSSVDKRKCHMPPCEDRIAAKWSAWSKWSACSTTCGAGSQTRTRRCKSTQPCDGNNLQIRKCPNMPECDVISGKREIDIPGSKESATESDLHIPEETYELQPEVLDGVRHISPEVDIFPTNPASSPLQFYEVDVTSNLDFSDSGPCEPGFFHNASVNTCEDVDECAIENNQCHSTQRCVNTAGGYGCGCQPGYAALGAGQRCLDVNECEQETDGCEFACVNIAGGYVCACPKHLRLHIDNHHCVEPAAYMKPYSTEEIDSGDYLGARVELPPKRNNIATRS